MQVSPNSTDISTYFSLRLTVSGVEATGLVVTNIDLQYVRNGATPAAKVDASALGAANSAHTDNSAIEVDPTDQPGLYRVDWPDAAFAAGVSTVILSVKAPACFTEHLRVELEPLQTGDSFARVGVDGAGLTALGDTRLANLDATISSRSTYAGGAVASVTAPVTVGTNNDKTGYALSAAGITALWAALTCCA